MKAKKGKKGSGGRKLKKGKKAMSKRTSLKIPECKELDVVSFLEKNWPGKRTNDVKKAFAELKSTIKTAGTKPAHPAIHIGEPVKIFQKPWPQAETGAKHFDLLSLVRKALMAEDMLFLSQQITYHVASTASLPKVYADGSQIHIIFLQLIEHLVRRSTRSSRIQINLAESSVQKYPGVEISFSTLDRHMEGVKPDDFLSTLFEEKADSVSGISLKDLRQVIERQHGKIWVELTKPCYPVFHIFLPVSEEVTKAPGEKQQTFKYDISIENYANLRKRFGIRKSYSLVDQIGHYVRSLVRQPFDMVMEMRDEGMITTIYETQKGAAQSLASRISQRLAAEKFRIGKREVDVSFSYSLYPLKSDKIENSQDEKQTGPLAS